MEQSPSLTVVIPTLNRARYLRYTLGTCVLQEYPRLDILVSNNASDDDTEEVVRSFDDPRIRYIRTEGRLGMSSHWEFALRHVDTDYVVFIGDDDALLGFTVEALFAVIRAFRPEAVRWQKNAYHWPDHPVPSSRNMLKIRFGHRVRRRDAFEVLRQVAAGNLWYGALPGIYHSCVRVDALRSMARHTGGLVFPHNIPDVWVCLLLGGCLKHFVEVELPLTTPGASAKSTGANVLFTEDAVKKFEKFNEESRASFQEIQCAPPTAFVDLFVLDMLRDAEGAIRKFGRYLAIKPYNFFYKAISREIGTATRLAQLLPELEKRAQFCFLHRLRLRYLLWVAARRKRLGGSERQTGCGLRGATLTLDGAKFGVHDVAAAADFCTRLLDGELRRMKDLLAERQPERES